MSLFLLKLRGLEWIEVLIQFGRRVKNLQFLQSFFIKWNLIQSISFKTMVRITTQIEKRERRKGEEVIPFCSFIISIKPYFIMFKPLRACLWFVFHFWEFISHHFNLIIMLTLLFFFIVINILFFRFSNFRKIMKDERDRRIDLPWALIISSNISSLFYANMLWQCILLFHL